MFNFGEHLKQLRKENNITQRELAELMSVSPRAIQNYELNSRKPTFEIIISLSKCLNVSSDYLLGINNENSITCNTEESNIISNYRKLSLKGKEKLLEYSRDLVNSETSHSLN